MKKVIEPVLNIGAKISLPKRQKIILVSIILTIGLISTSSVSFLFLRTQFLLALAILAYFLSLWALWEGMTKLKAVVLLILPMMFTLAVGSFYFLLPVRWLTRVPVAIIFGLSFYSLLLSQNVFNVAAIRTIPLYRAASTVSFLFTLITAFFLFNVVLALQLPFYWNGLIVFLITWPLILQVLWSLEMEKVTTLIVVYTTVLSLLISQTAIVLSFWPVAPTVWSLSLSTMMYVLLGITTESMREKLGRRVVAEFIGVGLLVFLFSFLVTSWTG